MAKNYDTLFRHWFMLVQIPRYPQRICTIDVNQILEGEGYEVDIRTIQRDLIKLSTLFPLSYEAEGRKNYWYWIKDAATQSLPGMDPATAIAFTIAESHLTSLLPQSTLNLLAPYFTRSKEVINSTQKSNLRGWLSKVAVVPRGLQLKPPSISANIQKTIYEGLLKERVIEIEYKAKSADEPLMYQVHPLGIVLRDSLIYLVCTFWKYPGIKQLALHRMSEATILDKKSNKPKAFKLDDYVTKNHGFSYPIGMKPIELEVIFNSGAAKHLRETQLSEDQTLETLDNGKTLLKATTVDSHELRWWLHGFGAHVEIISPKELRSHFIDKSKELKEIYLN